jgi:D-alanyl-lipoteichoic acid acyltransferase DltB (MBOAT superfamily)
MIVVGLWHGANWTFVAFGLYHGLLFVPLILSGAFMKKAKIKTNRFDLPIGRDFGRIFLTFALVVIGQIIFRADSIWQAWEYFCGMMQFGTVRASYRFFVQSDVRITSPFIVLMLVVEWLQRNKTHGLEISNIRYGWLRFAVYYVLIVFILNNFGQERTFIYFQF